MSPAQWIEHIQQKSHNVICVYQNQYDSITSRDSLYPENQISSCLQSHLEKWLMLALEYDPRKRGYGLKLIHPTNVSKIIPEGDKKSVTFSNTLDGEVVKELQIFTMLNKTLEKKIVNVSIINTTYQKHSYEIDDSTLLKTLLTWIERDIKVPQDSMVIVIPTKEDVDIDVNGYATQCWVTDYNEYAIFIWKTGLTLQDNLNTFIHKIPQLIEEYVCCNPKAKVPYHLVKRFSTNCMYLVQNEIKSYNCLIDGCKSNIKNMQFKASQLGTVLNQMNTDFEVFKKNISFVNLCLQHDVTRLKSITEIDSDYMINKWTMALEGLSTKVATVSDILKKLKVRNESINRRITGFNTKNVFIDAEENDDVQQLKNNTFVEYDLIKRAQKDKSQATKDTDCLALKRIILKFMKIREKLSISVDLKKNILYMMDIRIEISKLKTTIEAASNNVLKISKDVILVQTERQNDIWDLMKTNIQKQRVPPVEVTENKTPEVLSTSVTVDNPVKPAFMVGQSMTNFWPNNSDNLGLDVLNLSISGNFDLKSMINDNLSLRYANQDLINECFQVHKQVLNDDIDFNFLNDCN